MRERKRNVDIDKVDDANIEDLSNKIGQKVNKMIDDVIAEVNKLLGVYGMEAKMEVIIKEKENKEE